VLAAYAARIAPDDPLSALALGERPEPEVPDGWTTVEVRAASLNHHDLWSLRGVGLPEKQLPMTLDCDAAGLDADGRDVIVHSVIGVPDWRADETLNPSCVGPNGLSSFSSTRSRQPPRAAKSRSMRPASRYLCRRAGACSDRANGGCRVGRDLEAPPLPIRDRRTAVRMRQHW
jgi:hypothetical protein